MTEKRLYRHTHFRAPPKGRGMRTPYFKYATYTSSNQTLIVWFSDIVNTAVFRDVTPDTMHKIRVMLRTTYSWYIEAGHKDSMVWNFMMVYEPPSEEDGDVPATS